MGRNEPVANAKVCHLCGADLGQQRRVKDDQGRYFCPACWKSRQASGEDLSGKVVHGKVLYNFEDRSAQAASESQTRVCPFCAETIQARAIKCRYCGELLEPDPEFASSPMESVSGEIVADGSFLVVDCPVQITLDDQPIGSGSVKQGFSIPFKATAGPHEIAIRSARLKSQTYQVHFEEGGHYIIKTHYSKTWAKYADQCEIQQTQGSRAGGQALNALMPAPSKSVPSLSASAPGLARLIALRLTAIMFSIITLLGLVVGMGAISNQELSSEKFMWVGGVLVALIGITFYLWIVCYQIYTSKCPKCGAYSRRETVQSTLLDTQYSTELKSQTNRHYDREGKIIGTTLTQLPITVRTDTIHQVFKCRHCQHVWEGVSKRRQQ